MAKYRHKGRLDVYEKQKTSLGDIIGGAFGIFVIFALAASCAG
ncbi:MAG: hypothetical protein AAF950_06870 [Pseudomonadota bacterium]